MSKGLRDLPLLLFRIREILQILPEKTMAPHSSTLAWKIPWIEEPGRLQIMGSLQVMGTLVSVCL